MKTFTALLTLAVLASATLFAGLGVPGESNPLLASADIAINAVAGYTVDKVKDVDGVRIKVRDPQGKEFWVSNVLGDQEKKFFFNGQSSNLLIADLNADQQPEIITAVSYPPHNGSLHVFTLDKDQQGFVPMQFSNPQTNSSSEFLASDMLQEDGQDLTFVDNNRVRALGMLYPENEGAEAVASFFFYKLSGAAFTFDGSEPVPVDN
ncbi:MAG: hypothetical protein CVV41_00185 [Candidatus Riflebacteria bacterium HGW-Riflebacteria-1]|jgi:hypothetical protein|nr:MAG: hypothetical protein CVV41_00185 [Candidatus Riflebacteria bacterium HGW-Riflebacteria-1]